MTPSRKREVKCCTHPGCQRPRQVSNDQKSLCSWHSKWNWTPSSDALAKLLGNMCEVRRGSGQQQKRRVPGIWTSEEDLNALVALSRERLLEDYKKKTPFSFDRTISDKEIKTAREAGLDALIQAVENVLLKLGAIRTVERSILRPSTSKSASTSVTFAPTMILIQNYAISTASFSHTAVRIYGQELERQMERTHSDTTLLATQSWKQCLMS